MFWRASSCFRVIRYECCEGYQQVAGQQGCAGGTVLSHSIEQTLSSNGLLEKHIIYQTVKKFLKIYGNRKFITPPIRSCLPSG
jgi:hypothetical protein